ncbi:hypothetical protein [Nocardia sp. NPDC024068]
MSRLREDGSLTQHPAPQSQGRSAVATPGPHRTAEGFIGAIVRNRIGR